MEWSGGGHIDTMPNEMPSGDEVEALQCHLLNPYDCDGGDDDCHDDEYLMMQGYGPGPE